MVVVGHRTQHSQIPDLKIFFDIFSEIDLFFDFPIHLYE